MENRKKVISNLLKSIFLSFPNKAKIKSNGDEKKFELDYYAAKKVADKLNRSYYFGTELKYENQREFICTFKELLKIKRALIDIYK